MIREVVRVRGRVQGVGFRDRVAVIAEDYRVSGTVRNLRPREILEIDVEGERNEVDRFLDDVFAHPPTFARVEGVDREPAQPRGVDGFTIAKTAQE
jgi:hydrogenase maturation factor HypF (carbamoyltransferase family)